ncbi:MAG: FAD-dependent oxidoreductase, partial [Pirellulales bacterium]|nr:FAD-dependent oxidoreductase [Pirellulales bacterium]
MPVTTEIPIQPRSRGDANRQDPLCPGGLSRLVVVGGGMAGFGLCDRLVSRGGTDQWRITLFGEERSPAYDRVNLSKLFGGKRERDLLLADRHWYDQHHIDLHTGCRITAIDRHAQQVVSQSGKRYPYDRLILATGSRARIPAIPGSNLPGVFVYRTLQDLQDIGSYVSKRQAAVGAVIGGGLLGLEAARVLQDLGLKTHVIEMAPGLMPRQLDAQAAQRLKREVEKLGVNVHLVRRTQSITADCSAALSITFENAAPLPVDVLIIAAGVIPNDELARQSGLAVAERGGIIVDECLNTNDPNIHAVGECVNFRQHIYGLVAPCYRMADVLANRLVGDGDTFEGADESAELKLLGINVAALGQAIGDSPAGITLTQNDDHGYRKLILNQGRIVGA